MKLILTYINPKHQIDWENDQLIKVQIDNSLQLGWDVDDILLVTNFPYQYGAVKSVVVSDDAFVVHSPISCKITAILELFRLGYIKKRTMYWAHDLDAFQLVSFPESEIQICNREIGLCDYGRMPKCAGGSVFFKSGAIDLFGKIRQKIYELKTVDEVAITILTNENEVIKKRIKKQNISYNFLTFNLASNYAQAVKPIRVAHFHPTRGVRQSGIDNALEWFKGKNKLSLQIVPNRLVKLLAYHGIK